MKISKIGIIGISLLMLAVADRNSGVGHEIRTIAQNQEQGETENSLETAKKEAELLNF